MLNQNDFLEKFNIAEAAFMATELKWKELEAIFDDYLIFKEELEPTAIMLFNKLMKSRKVHSVRYRIKDPEHLIEKIIRKKIENKESNLTLENYKEELTDLIGLRALHLFKEDWEFINDFISETWDLKQKPVANYRKGDTEQIIEFFKKKGCEPKEHKYGYRSVHYIIKTQPGRQIHFGEIQIRTIFEEAWAEIDHTIRYPYDLENPIFFQFLLILNRLSGSADEMGSFIQFLKSELEVRDKVFKNQMQEKDTLISDLETKIEKLNLQGQELNEVKEDLRKLKAQKIKGTFLDSSIFDIQKEYGKLFTASDSLTKLNDTMKWMEKLGKPITIPSLNFDALNAI
jgi:putative GTP pyrophosphokinase